MRTKTAAALVGAALIAAVAPLAGRADEKADALLKQVEAATRAAKTLSADLEMSAPSPGQQPQKATGSVVLKRPNLARIEMTGGPFAQTIVSDGKTLWTVMPGGSQYQKGSADPSGGNINTLWAFPVRYFFNPTVEFFGGGSTPSTRLAGTENVGGKTFQIVEVSGEKPVSHTVKMYIGPDKLFHRAAVTLKQGDNSVTYEAALRNVQVDKAVADTAFAYTPPATAKLYEPPDLNAKLVAVGKKAPSFDLPTPTGGKLALENTLKDKKAVLVNFWFYN